MGCVSLLNPGREMKGLRQGKEETRKDQVEDESLDTPWSSHRINPQFHRTGKRNRAPMVTRLNGVWWKQPKPGWLWVSAWRTYRPLSSVPL